MRRACSNPGCSPVASARKSTDRSTAPEPARNRDVAQAIGRVMGRPSWLPVPGFAVRLLVGEMADMVVTGGADTFNDIFMYMCFSKTPALSASGKIRPFAEASDGTLIGEGLGMCVLKRLSDVQAFATRWVAGRAKKA